MTMTPYSIGLLIVALGARADWVQQEQGVRPYDPEHSLWVLEREVPPEHQLTMTVALKVEEERVKELEKIFWEVSDPKHERYGQHLGIDDVTKLLDVPELRVNSVVQYFKEAGAESVEVAPNKDMITVQISAAAAEKALKTKLGFFTHSVRSDIRIVRSSTT
jgi:tripeptidyl-peptidase-1